MKKIGILVLWLQGSLLSAQTLETLEAQRQHFEQLIAQTSELLAQMQESKSSTLSRLKLLNLQIRQRRQLLAAIQSEIKLIDQSIGSSTEVLSALENDLKELREEFARLLYASSKLQYADKLSYLFSSKTFNDLWLRGTYFRQYAQLRRKQIELIERVTHQIQEKTQQLATSRQNKLALLQKEQTATSEIATALAEQKKLVDQLRLRENQLLYELSRYRKQYKEAEKIIENQVEENLESVSTGKTAEGEFKLLPEAGKLSSSFQANKGKLGWPVEQGVVSGQFGKQPHPVLENIFIENKGIEIRTRAGEIVRSVFGGKVTAVTKIPGMNYLVLIQHGEYFSVYVNLVSPKVKTGQSVLQGDELGMVATDDAGVSELQFQIWKGNQKLDPQSWLRKVR